MKHLAALKEQVGIQLQRAGRILLVDLVLEGGQAGYRRVVRRASTSAGKTRVQIGTVVAQMHLLHAAGGVQQSAEVLQGHEDGNAHHQGADRDGGASGAALQIHPGIERGKGADGTQPAAVPSDAQCGPAMAAVGETRAAYRAAGRAARAAKSSVIPR